MTSVDAALRRARQSIAPGEARQLLCHLLDRPHAWLVAHGDAELTDEGRFLELVARRAAGEPIAYLVGRREFYGRNFAVAPEVLIPRPETELLVELGLAQTAHLASPRLLDLGSGSGCIAVTLALELPKAQVTAAEYSPLALAMTERNARAHGVTLALVCSDWFTSLRGEGFDLIVSNPPYVAAGDAHLGQGDLRYEPQVALVSGVDGLAAIRAIVATAPAHLRPGGMLAIEHGYDQAAAVLALFAAAGFCQIEQRRDLANIIRVTAGKVA